MLAKLVPELLVFSFQNSLTFYCQILGFTVLYDRLEECFAYLDLEGAQLMIEEVSKRSRQFGYAPLDKPLGRGMNLQIQVSNVDEIYERALVNSATVTIPLEEKWYRKETQEVGNRQFVVSDPDGYLLRLTSDLGNRPLQS